MNIPLGPLKLSIQPWKRKAALIHTLWTVWKLKSFSCLSHPISQTFPNQICKTPVFRLKGVQSVLTPHSSHSSTHHRSDRCSERLIDDRVLSEEDKEETDGVWLKFDERSWQILCCPGGIQQERASTVLKWVSVTSYKWNESCPFVFCHYSMSNTIPL